MSERKHRKHVPMGYMGEDSISPEKPKPPDEIEEPGQESYKSTCKICAEDFEDTDGEAHAETFNAHTNDHSESRMPAEA